MSWSINKSGTVEEVVEALEDHRNCMVSDQSKEEYDLALPHLVALVKENVGGKVELSASGHGYKHPSGEWAEKTCQINIKRG